MPELTSVTTPSGSNPADRSKRYCSAKLVPQLAFM